MRLLHAGLHDLDLRAADAGQPAPSDEEIVDTLGGHICRCTGYQTIVEAVHLAVEKMRGQMSDVEFRRRSRACRTAPRATSASRSSASRTRRCSPGQTEFIDNVVLPRMLHCAILRSPHAHARIVAIDTSEAEKLPGRVRGRDGRGRQALVEPDDDGAAGVGHALSRDRQGALRRRAGGGGRRGQPLRRRGRARADRRRVRAAAGGRRRAEGARARQPAALRGARPQRHAAEALHLGRRRRGVRERRPRGAESISAGTVSAPTRSRPSASSASGISSTASLTCRGSFQAQGHFAMARAMVFNLPLNKVRFISQPHGGSFGGKGGARGTDITALLVAQGRRPAGQVDRGPHGVPRRRREPGVGSPLRRGARARRERQGHGLQGEAARRPRRHRRGLGRRQRRQAAHQLHRLLRHPGGAIRPDDRRHQQAPRQPLSRHGPAAAQLGAGAADGPRGAEARARPRRDPAPELHSARRLSLHDRERQRVRQRRLRAPRSRPRSRWPTIRRSAPSSSAARAEGRYLGIGLVNTIEPGVFDWNAYAIVGQPGTGVPEGATVASTSSASSRSRSGSRSKGRGSTPSRRRCSPTISTSTSPTCASSPLDTLSAPPHFGPGGSRLGVALTGAVLGAAARLTEKLIAVARRALPDHARARRAAGTA